MTHQQDKFLQRQKERFSILDLDDPIDRQIAKIDLTIQALMGRSGLGGRTNLDILREAGIGGVGALRLTVLELFTSITLPDFLAPLEFVPEEFIPDPPPTDQPSRSSRQCAACPARP